MMENHRCYIMNSEKYTILDLTWPCHTRENKNLQLEDSAEIFNKHLCCMRNGFKIIRIIIFFLNGLISYFKTLKHVPKLIYTCSTVLF